MGKVGCGGAEPNVVCLGYEQQEARADDDEVCGSSEGSIELTPIPTHPSSR